jgi:hypothetical protein
MFISNSVPLDSPISESRAMAQIHHSFNKPDPVSGSKSSATHRAEMDRAITEQGVFLPATQAKCNTEIAKEAPRLDADCQNLYIQGSLGINKKSTANHGEIPGLQGFLVHQMSVMHSLQWRFILQLKTITPVLRAINTLNKTASELATHAVVTHLDFRSNWSLLQRDISSDTLKFYNQRVQALQEQLGGCIPNEELNECMNVSNWKAKQTSVRRTLSNLFYEEEIPQLSALWNNQIPAETLHDLHLSCISRAEESCNIMFLASLYYQSGLEHLYLQWKGQVPPKAIVELREQCEKRAAKCHKERKDGTEKPSRRMSA